MKRKSRYRGMGKLVNGDRQQYDNNCQTSFTTIHCRDDDGNEDGDENDANDYHCPTCTRNGRKRARYSLSPAAKISERSQSRMRHIIRRLYRLITNKKAAMRNRPTKEPSTGDTKPETTRREEITRRYHENRKSNKQPARPVPNVKETKEEAKPEAKPEQKQQPVQKVEQEKPVRNNGKSAMTVKARKKEVHKAQKVENKKRVRRVAKPAKNIRERKEVISQKIQKVEDVKNETTSVISVDETEKKEETGEKDEKVEGDKEKEKVDSDEDKEDDYNDGMDSSCLTCTCKSFESNGSNASNASDTGSKAPDDLKEDKKGDDNTEENEQVDCVEQETPVEITLIDCVGKPTENTDEMMQPIAENADDQVKTTEQVDTEIVKSVDNVELDIVDNKPNNMLEMKTEEVGKEKKEEKNDEKPSSNEGGEEKNDAYPTQIDEESDIPFDYMN